MSTLHEIEIENENDSENENALKVADFVQTWRESTREITRDDREQRRVVRLVTCEAEVDQRVERSKIKRDTRHSTL